MSFIVFEGVDGVGKTTIIKSVSEELRNKGLDVILTREPGGTPVAEKIRELLLSKDNTIDRDTEILLFFAARCSHVKNVIHPALEAGKIVLCDRYFYSTLAYQYKKDELDKELHKVSNKYPWLLHPDKVIFLDATDDTIEKRLSSRNKELDRIEKTRKRKDVRDNFYYISRKMGKKFSLYNAESNVDELTHVIVEDILTLNKEKVK